MRVAYVTRAVAPQHGYGGLERAGTDLMEHLLRQGTDVALLTKRLPPGQPIRPPDGGWLTVMTAEYDRLPIRPNGIPARLTNYRSFVEDLGRRVRVLACVGLVECVYAHGLCAWGARHASEWGLALIANPHGLEEFKTRDRLKRLAYAPFRAWVREGCKAAQRVVATDSSMREEVALLLGIDPLKIVVLPNGIDAEKGKSYLSREVQAELVNKWLHFADSREHLKGISVGRLEPNKGFAHLLRALASVKTDLGEGWSWTVVGEGTLRQELERLAGELGLAGRVYFAGHLSDSELHNLYALSDLFAHPTLYEGSSLVTLEAMAHGLPVVASRVGGIPDKVTDGKNGFLVGPGDEVALAARIKWMAQHKEQRMHMGGFSTSVAEQFGWPRIAAATLKVMQEIVAEMVACGVKEAPSRTH